MGDKRRNDRFLKIVETVADHPTASVPQAQNQWYDTKATYQFWSSPKVDSMQLLQAIGRATAQRAMDYPMVLIFHDTTNIGFSSSSAEELGYLDHGRGKGVLAHNTFVVSPHGVPIGLAGSMCGFVRSSRWESKPAVQLARLKTKRVIAGWKECNPVRD